MPMRRCSLLLCAFFWPAPAQDAVPSADKDEEKFLSSRRLTWIDEKEGVAVKYLEVFQRPTAGLLPGSEIERDFGKHGDAWLLDLLILRYDARLMGVVHGHGESRCRLYDYKKFEVESKIVEQ